MRALVTLGEMLPEGEAQSTGSVIVVRSAPNVEVLKHAAAAITHCGQDDTAARVVHAGAGIRLKPRSSPETIARALTALLADDRFRSNARRLAVAIAEEQRSNDVVAELERIGRRAVTCNRNAGRPNESSQD